MSPITIGRVLVKLDTISGLVRFKILLLKIKPPVILPNPKTNKGTIRKLLLWCESRLDIKEDLSFAL